MLGGSWTCPTPTEDPLGIKPGRSLVVSNEIENYRPPPLQDEYGDKIKNKQ